MQAYDQARRAAVLLKRATRAAKRSNWLVKWLSRRMKWEQLATELNKPRDRNTTEGRIRRKMETFIKLDTAPDALPFGGGLFDGDGRLYYLNAGALYDKEVRTARHWLRHEYEHSTQEAPDRTRMSPEASQKALDDNEVAAFGAQAETLGTDGGPDLPWVPPWTSFPNYDVPRINQHMIDRYLKRVVEVVTPMARHGSSSTARLLGRYLDGYQAGLEQERRDIENMSQEEPRRGVRAWVENKWVAHSNRRYRREAERRQSTELIQTPEQAFQAGEWDAWGGLAPHVRAHALLEAIQHQRPVHHDSKD